ncbi:MAG TPA: NAD(P)H-binding protein [Nitrospirota bacterium]|nr:NAD(P)H-binding protein [Nitrospirota bacterium]
MITILGATGHVGSKIADILIKKREPVRLVARSSDRLRPLADKQSEVFAGDALDTDFLVRAFSRTDAVFVLVPPNKKSEKFMLYADAMGESIARALELAKVKYVVNLSSVGADLPEGTGPIAGLHHQEARLNRIKGLNVLHLRPATFMENLLMNIDLIKTRGITGNSIRGDLKFPMIATKDIAAYAAEHLVRRDFTGSLVHYLLGQRDLSLIEATEIIGRKINKPGLAYVMFPYDEAEKSLVAMGLSPDVSRVYVEMSRAFNDGLIKYEERSAENTTPTTFEEFCDEVFVPLFTQKKAA